MDDEPRTNLVAAAVEAIDERTAAQTAVIAAALVRRGWPGGIGDRSEPAALAWVRRWGATGRPPAYADCSCLEGRCAVCN